MEEKEVDMLVSEMSGVAKKFSKIRPQTLVVLDSAARPLALPMKKILKDAFGQKVQVRFISPTFIKTIHEIYVNGGFEYTPERFELMRENLVRELPGFLDAIKGKRVAILDEQKATGKTLEAMESFVKYFGAARVIAQYLSSFSNRPEYSWRENRVRFARKARNELYQFLSRRTKDKRSLQVRKDFAKQITPRVIRRLKK